MPDLKAIPIQRAGVLREQIDDETLLYRHVQKKMVYLNDSAATVWNLCDGQRTIGEIIALLTGAYPEAQGQIEADVRATIDTLLDEGVLQLTNKQPAPNGP